MPATSTPTAEVMVYAAFAALAELTEVERDGDGPDILASFPDLGGGVDEFGSTAEEGWLGVEGVCVTLADGREFIVTAQEVLR